MAIEMSRVINLLNVARLKGQLYLPPAAIALGERYQFTEFPRDNLDRLQAETLEFKHGVFEDAAVDLTIYNDGLVVTSRSDTAILQAFLEDLKGWATSVLGLHLIRTHDVDTMYESGLVVRSEVNVLRPLTSMETVAGRVSSLLRDATGQEAEFLPFGLSFAPSNKVIGLKPTPFRLERRAAVDASTNQYFSFAPLKTEAHLAVLEEWEQLVASA